MSQFLLLPFGGSLLAIFVFFVSREHLRLSTAVSFLGANSVLGFFWSFGCALLTISGSVEDLALSGDQTLISLPEPSILFEFSAYFFVAFVLTYMLAYLIRKKITPEKKTSWPWK